MYPCGTQLAPHCGISQVSHATETFIFGSHVIFLTFGVLTMLTADVMSISRRHTRLRRGVGIWRQRFRGLLRCHLELATYRSASLVTVCGDVCQTPESLLVSSPELAHLRTIYFALYKCTHYCYLLLYKNNS